MSYKICNRCVMDNVSDKTITFDQEGHCNYCTSALFAKDLVFFPGTKGEQKLEELISQIKQNGQGKPYDCIMGLSGGLDSSYLAYLGSIRYNLRILAVHVDDGFDAPVSKKNLERLAKACSIDLYLERPDSEQYFNLIAAFFRARVPNLAIPQDNLIYGYLHKYARENHISYFLSGGNFALESILQRGNTHSSLDAIHISDINKKFGKTPLDKLEITSHFKSKIGNRFRFGLKEVRPLNFIDYRKNQAINELGDFCGFDYYGGKHHESIFTRFLQVYYLPKKFNVDKRKSHFSSMIISGQMNRVEALEELKKPLYDQEFLERDIAFILERLDMPRSEFELIMASPPRNHSQFKTSPWIIASWINRKIRGY